MIYIHTNNSDYSTTQVVDWLFYKKADFEITNGQVLTPSSSLSYRISQNESHFKINDKDQVVDPEQVKAVWHRRSESMGVANPLLNKLSGKLWEQIKNFQHNEYDALKTGFYHILSQKNTLSDPLSGVHINKLYALEQATSVGLGIPETLVCNTKKELQDFYNEVGRLIIKPIGNSEFYEKEGTSYLTYTEPFDQEHIAALPDLFYPCFVQACIEKEYEIRTFYLNEKCYSMAIFSQENEQTAVDFRRYDHDWPNINVPYQLPKEIEEKVTLFMNKVKLDTGSLDIIKGQDGKYVFIEVNPVGQFGMVSYPCNYNLEEKIADHLIQLQEN